MPARVVVLASGSGSTLQALLDAADPVERAFGDVSDACFERLFDTTAPAGGFGEPVPGG